MRKPTLSILTIAVVLIPLTVLTQKIQSWQDRNSSTTVTRDRAPQTINHNAYDLPLKANATVSPPVAEQQKTFKTRLNFWAERLALRQEK